MPKTIQTVGLEMPDDFPADAYEAVHRTVCARPAKSPATWREYAGAWNAVAYRFKSLADHDEAFTASIRRVSSTPLPSDRHIQERELFNFFTNGLATIESFCYGLFGIASMMDSANFPMVTFDDKKKVTPRKTAEKFATHFKGEGITAVLQRVVADPDFERWEGLRNILSHRVALGRAITAFGEATWENVELKVGGTPGPEKMNIDANTTASRRQWLAGSLRDLLAEAEAWCARHALAGPPSAGS
jgi:hypothetical protein